MSEPRSEQHGKGSSKPRTGPRSNGGTEAGAATEQPPLLTQKNGGSQQAGAKGPSHARKPTAAPEPTAPIDEATPPATHYELPAGETNASWREHALTRIEELDDYVDQLEQAPRKIQASAAKRARMHLEAAQLTAEQRGDRLGARFANSVHIERVMSHIDAAEARILRAAPLDHVAAQIPAILDHVRSHLAKDNAQREQAEAIGAAMREHGKTKLDTKIKLTERERGMLVGAFRAASEEQRREIMRVRSFRNVLIVAGALVALLVVLLGFLGALYYQDVDVCFNPVEKGGGGRIVCPLNETAYSKAQAGDLDQLTNQTASRWDVPAILVLGGAAAALSAAVALRQVKGSSTPFSLPVALAVLKIPTGALTALLGLILLRGQFIPGFSALDFPAQVIAWAVLLGYAQQLLTRVIDQRAQMVLDAVGEPPKPK